MALGKSAAARRILPMTPRVRSSLENRWLAVGKTGFVWPGKTGTGYIHDETLRRAQLKTVQATNMCHFVLHSIRHTFLTRLGESGCDVWTLGRRCAGRNVALGWAQDWAHRSSSAAVSSGTACPNDTINSRVDIVVERQNINIHNKLKRGPRLGSGAPKGAFRCQRRFHTGVWGHPS
jgi:hypothetical protein